MKKLYQELKEKGVINDKVTLGDLNPYDKQIGGSHYQNFKIQPSKFINENELLYPEGCVIKYVLRHRLKGKRQDLEKAIHVIEMIIERDYGDHTHKSQVFKSKKEKI